MKICPNCGTEVEKKFCPDCGTEYVEPEIVEEGPVAEEVVEGPMEESEEEASYEVRQEIVPVPNTQREYKTKKSNGKFSARSTGIVAYIGWIGLIIAVILGDRDGGKFHLNQALVIYLASIIIGTAGGLLPILGGLVAFAGGIFTLVCWGLGLYYAISGQEKEVPLIGQIKLL